MTTKLSLSPFWLHSSMLLFHHFCAICRHYDRCCCHSDCHRSNRSLAIDRPWQALPPLFDGSLAGSFNWYLRGHGTRLMYKNCYLDRTKTRTRERKDLQLIRTVWDISRDDRARIATFRLRSYTAMTLLTYMLQMTVLSRHETFSQILWHWYCG